MERSNRIGWAQVRAGVFIFIALLGIAGGVLLMGQKTKMFVAKGELRIMMDDVAGLKVGAPVWLAGVDVGAVDAWDLTTGDTNVIVAVIDTGIRYTHRDLAAQMWRMILAGTARPRSPAVTGQLGGKA